MHFNPRSLAGATLAIICLDLRRWNFNPRSLAGATQTSQIIPPNFLISIHAPLRERRNRINIHHATMHFNPRSLAGATHLLCRMIWLICNFNPRSLAGATLRFIAKEMMMINFNPRSLAGATDYADQIISLGYISIHAPLRERRNLNSISSLFTLFQSTLPCGSDARFCYN